MGRELGCGFIKERAKEGVKKKASEFLREREREESLARSSTVVEDCCYFVAS